MTCKYATKSGHLEILQWLRAQNPPCPWNKEDCILCAGANTNIGQWIMEN